MLKWNFSNVKTQILQQMLKETMEGTNPMGMFCTDYTFRLEQMQAEHHQKMLDIQVEENNAMGEKLRAFQKNCERNKVEEAEKKDRQEYDDTASVNSQAWMKCAAAEVVRENDPPAAGDSASTNSQWTRGNATPSAWTDPWDPRPGP